MVAVDDTDAHHVYVAYAQNTSYRPINENIVVQDSRQRRPTWPAARTVTVNSGVDGAALHAVGVLGRRCRIRELVRSDGRRRRLHQPHRFFRRQRRARRRGNLRRHRAACQRRQLADNQCEAGAPPGTANSWPNFTARPATRRTARRNSRSSPGAAWCLAESTDGTQSPCDFSAGGRCRDTDRPPQRASTVRAAEIRRLQRQRMRGRTLLLDLALGTPPPPAAPGARSQMFFAALVVAGAQIQSPGPVIMPDACVGPAVSPSRTCVIPARPTSMSIPSPPPTRSSPSSRPHPVTQSRSALRAVSRSRCVSADEPGAEVRHRSPCRATTR